MSFASSMLFAVMKMTRLKKRLANRSLQELHKSMSFPNPPESIRKICSIEKVEHETINAFWLNKENNKKRILVYLHGGAYVYGPIDFQWEYIAEMCRKSGMATLVIDYKKLPDFPFPSGLDEIVLLLSSFINSKIISGNYFIVGDSAGASLAIATCYQFNKMNIRPPEKLILMSPCVDISCSLSSNGNCMEQDPVVSLEFLQKMQKAYCLDNNPENPLISPLFGDVKILPPILLQCGTREMLLWDIRRFYFKCLEANVKIQYEEYPGMIHVFPTMSFLPEAKKAQESQLKFLLKKQTVDS